MPRLDDFKNRFPNLEYNSPQNVTGYTDEQITNAFEAVDLIYAKDDLAKLYAVAHWLEYSSTGGEATSVRSDAGLTESRKPIAKTASDSFWATSEYGVKFLMIKRQRSPFSLRSI